MNTAFLKARQTRYIAYATVYILVVVAVIAVANVLANRYNKSYDSTKNKKFSLSDQSLKIVRGLSQDATITYYDRTGQFASAKDLLDLYEKASPKVKVVYIDPDKNPQQARAAGIKNYGTAVVQVGAKKEEAKSLSEEGVTGAFIRDIKQANRTVCFVTGNGEHRIDDTSERDGYSRLHDLLGQDEYTSKSISLLEKAEVPSDCTVLVVAGPSTDYQQPEVDAIKKYIEGGGRGMFMLDPPLRMGRSAPAENAALLKLFQSWGVQVDKDLVLDLNPIGQLAGLGPQVALVTNYESHPIVSEMKGTATGFPLTRTLELTNSEKSSVSKLLESSATSLATSNLSSPAIDTNDPKNKKGPLTIAAAGTYDTGKPNSQGRFVIFGSSSWAANSFINFNGNSDLALNTMNWLSSDEDLISIRPKPQDDQRIDMTNRQMTWVRASSQFLLPAVVVIAGILVWFRRR